MKADLELMKAVEHMKMGEERGFNVFYAKTNNFVYARARHAINDEQDALDLVQEVYIIAYRNIESLREIEYLYAWLGAITLRQGARMANKKKHQVLLSEEHQEMIEEVADETVKLESSIINAEHAEILKRMLEKLPEEQKSVIISYYYDGLKVEQMAELAKTSAGTIKSRLYLARKRLKKYILELEKKEGITLRGFNTPLLLMSVKMLLEETQLSHASEQYVYHQICDQMGTQASALHFSQTKENTLFSLEKGVGEKLKGQGLSMNKIIIKLAELGKVKLAAIAVGAVAIIGAGTATGIYVNQTQAAETEAQIKIQKEKEDAIQKEQEKLLEDLLKRYKKAKELYQNLILETAVQDILKTDLKKIQDDLDKKKVDGNTEKQMTTLEKNLEGYRKQNEQYLTQKEAGLYNYHTDLFPKENQEALDTVYSEYQKLFKAEKYKKADRKLDAMITTITAFLEDHQEDNYEVASNEVKTGETGKKADTGNSNTSDNTNIGTANNTQNETPSKTENPDPAEQPTEAPAETPKEPEKTGDFVNGWTYVEVSILNTICNAWYDFKYDDAGAQAQLAAQLPGRTCTLVHYPPEQNAEARALWDSLDSDVYCISNLRSDDVYGSWFIYGK